jgi:chromosome segregation ATPase
MPSGNGDWPGRPAPDAGGAHGENGGNGEVISERPASTGALSRWSKRDQTLTQLQEGYQRFTQVIEDVQQHMVKQGERTDRICSSLEQLAKSLGDLPTLNRQQSDTLDSISAQIHKTGERTEQITQAMNEMPGLARSQAEAMGGIQRQLQIAGEQDAIARATMERISTTISSLGESNAAQTEALKQMYATADRQADRLKALVAKQTRHFALLFSLTLLLTVAAVIAVVVTLALSQGPAAG